jgi:hypothetical protein
MLSRSTVPSDVLLWKKVEEAKAAWQPTQGAASDPAPTGSTETAQKPAEAPKATAQPTSWRDYVITIKSPTLTGKKLGELDAETIQKIKTTYLDVIDQKRMTLEQKKLAAFVAQALAELLPATGNSEEPEPEQTQGPEEPEHTAAIKRGIEFDKLLRADFLKVCRDNGYISATATRIEDITEDETVALMQGWAQVCAEVRAIQP